LLAVGQPPAIGPRSKAANVERQIGQRKSVVIFRAPEILFRPRSAFGGNIRITAIPFVWPGILDAFEQLVADNVAAKSARLQIPCNGVDVMASNVESMWQEAQPICP
jgi:hypothetical protein